MPTDWQARYEAGDIRWDKGAPAPPLADYLARRPIAGDVLVPGCGTGHDVRLLAAQKAQVLGMDIAPGALELARAHSPAGDETYRLADFLALDPSLHHAFDWVVEHTLFCAIDRDRRPDYLRAVCQALRPHGRLFAIHYMEVEDEAPDSPPWGTTIEELDALFGPHFTTLEQYRPEVGYDSRTGRELVRVLEKV